MIHWCWNRVAMMSGKNWRRPSPRRAPGELAAFVGVQLIVWSSASDDERERLRMMRLPDAVRAPAVVDGDHQTDG
jgi:hypothetical protein